MGSRHKDYHFGKKSAIHSLDSIAPFPPYPRVIWEGNWRSMLIITSTQQTMLWHVSWFHQYMGLGQNRKKSLRSLTTFRTLNSQEKLLIMHLIHQVRLLMLSAPQHTAFTFSYSLCVPSAIEHNNLIDIELHSYVAFFLPCIIDKLCKVSSFHHFFNLMVMLVAC